MDKRTDLHSPSLPSEPSHGLREPASYIPCSVCQHEIPLSTAWREGSDYVAYFAGWNVTTDGATSRAVSDYLYPVKALVRWFDLRMQCMREHYRIPALRILRAEVLLRAGSPLTVSVFIQLGGKTVLQPERPRCTGTRKKYYKDF